MRGSTNTATVELSGEAGLVITRELAAPARLVYRAWTTPALIRRWWAGDLGEVTLAEVNLWVGGTWRYVMRTHDGGAEVGFHGEFAQIVPDARIVSTETYEGAPDGQAVNTLTLTESAGRTTLRIEVQHQCRDHRDAHLDSGMERGMQGTMNHLEQVAISQE